MCYSDNKSCTKFMHRIQIIIFVKYLCFSKEFRPKFLALREYSNVSLILIFLTVTFYILARYWIHILPTATLYVLPRYSSQTYSWSFALKFKFKFDLKNNGLSRFMFQRGIQTKQPSRVSRESLSSRSILFFFRMPRFMFSPARRLACSIDSTTMYKPSNAILWVRGRYSEV